MGAAMMGFGRNMDEEPIDKPDMFVKYREAYSEDRPIREMKATKEEMDRAFLPRKNRDYCAHLFMDYKQCIRGNFPRYAPCLGIMHNYSNCTIEDEIHRMKEYERVRRLMRRDREAAKSEAA